MLSAKFNRPAARLRSAALRLIPLLFLVVEERQLEARGRDAALGVSGELDPGVHVPHLASPSEGSDGFEVGAQGSSAAYWRASKMRKIAPGDALDPHI